MQQILAVSDEPSFLHTLTHRFAPYDIEVVAAQSGEQALQVLCHDSPDLVVLSEHVPDLPADEVCRLIRSEGYRDLPVILLHSQP